MTRFWLIILRIICIIQILIAISKCFVSLVGLIGGQFVFLLQAIAFALIAALPVFTFIISNNIFPDKPIEGKLKKNFNRLFLINVLLTSFLFGFVFKDYKQAMSLSDQVGHLYFVFFIDLSISIATLLFHFSILYGLYWLRSHINNNASSKQFDFEEPNENGR
jgi:hypothetical protein